jgi:hypothetical protein
MRRIFRLFFKDETFFDKEIEKAAEVTLSNDKDFMYIERMKSGKYRLTWSKNFFNKDIKELKNIEIVRED